MTPALGGCFHWVFGAQMSPAPDNRSGWGICIDGYAGEVRWVRGGVWGDERVGGGAVLG